MRHSETAPSATATFDDSFDGGFANVAGSRPPGLVDPFAALATSSPTSTNDGVSADLSGINFSASSADSVVPEKRATLEPMAYAKPNYQAFYSVSSTMNTPAVVEKASSDKNAAKSATAATASLDIFQSVAASAFQQFGNAVPSGGGFAKKSGGVVEATTTPAGLGGRMTGFNNAMTSKTPETGYRFGGGGEQVGVDDAV